MISKIDEFKGAWATSATLAPDRLSALRQVARIQSIGSSTRIDGSKLSDREVARLLADLEGKTLATGDEQEMAGYAQALELIYSSWKDIALTESLIKQLHRDALAHSDRDAWHRGSYKSSANHVVAFDEKGGQIGVMFETALPHSTPFLMADLVAWMQEQTESKKLHSLLLIGLWVVSFLEIHPFQNGNGRLSRLICSLLLLRAGYAFVPYSSLESVIEQNVEAYFLAWRQTQGAIHADEPDRHPWLVFFLRSIAEQVHRLEQKIHYARTVLGPLPELSHRIVEFVREHGRVTMSQAIRLTGGNRNTLKQHFRVLVQSGNLRRRGQGRGVWYELA